MKSFTAALLMAVAALAPTMIQAQDQTLAVRALAGSATCPAPTGDDVNANVLAVVNFVETATASVALADQPLLEADVSVDLQVCLCVAADVELNAIMLGADAEAAAEADIEAFVAANADTSAVSAAVNNILQIPGAELNLDLVPTSRVNCVCPVEATPTCVDGFCSCNCPTGFNYIASSNICALSASANARTKRSRAFSSYDSRQVKRSDLANRAARAAFRA